MSKLTPDDKAKRVAAREEKDRIWREYEAKRLKERSMRKWRVKEDNLRKSPFSKNSAHGAGIGAKRPKGIAMRDEASFCCPYCKTSLKSNLVRLRQDFFQCRVCSNTFIKENVIDDFDFDY